MTLKFPICGQVQDVDRTLWDVRDVRTTKHGFDLHFGTPADEHGAYRGGLPRLIATKELWNFWDDNRTRGDGFLFDLPAGRTTLKRVRRRLGFNFVDDREDMWSRRVEDLILMQPRDFSRKYGVKRSLAFGRRRKMTGRRARGLGWWRKAKVREVLLAELTLSAAGKKLGISTSHVKRLKDRAKGEAG